jgi:hypothetical protein
VAIADHVGDSERKAAKGLEVLARFGGESLSGDAGTTGCPGR